MKIRVRLASAHEPEARLLKLAGISAVVHIFGLIIFSVLPRFVQPPIPPRPYLVGQLVPASSIASPPVSSPPPPRPAGPTPSERAAEARKALEKQQKIPEPPARKKPKSDPTIPPLEKPKKTAERKPEPDPPVSPPVPSPGPAEERPGSGEPAENAPPESPGSPVVSFGGEGTDDSGIPWIGSSAFPYDYYRASLVAILQSNWKRPLSPGMSAEPLRCGVKFTIAKTGAVQNVSLVEPSGNTALDLSAQRAVLASNPLPPLPFQYGNASVSAVVYFELTDE